MNLADLDRPTVTWRYDQWDQDIVFRPINATTYAMLATDFAPVHGESADTPAALRFYAALLAACVQSHKYTADEWMEASGPTLQALGMQALKVNHLLVEEAKKN
jgi:L-serine deaminase